VDEQRRQEPDVFADPGGGEPDDAAGFLGDEAAGAVPAQQVQLNALPLGEIAPGPLGASALIELALSEFEDLERVREVSRGCPPDGRREARR
jgi:hypothetical protein